MNIIATVDNTRRTDTKLVVITNKTVIANTNKLTSNAKRAYTNIEITIVTNKIAIANKAISNAKKMHANVMASSNSRIIRKLHINKVGTIDESNAKKVNTNIVAITNVIMIAKKKADTNLATIAKQYQSKYQRSGDCKR